MEPNCAIQVLNSGKAWLHGFVSDDDSSCCAALKHSYQDKIDSRSQLTKKGFRKASCWILEPTFLGWPIILMMSSRKSSIQANKLMLSIQNTRCRDFDLQFWVYNETKFNINQIQNFELQWQHYLNMNSMDTSFVVHGASMLSFPRNNGKLSIFRMAVNYTAKLWMHLVFGSCSWII